MNHALRLVLLTPQFYAASHETTQLVAAHTLRIAKYLNQWQRDHGAPAYDYPDRTRMCQQRLEQCFVDEGFNNPKQGGRIESSFYLLGHLALLDRVVDIHRIDIQTVRPQPQSPFGFQNLTPAVAQSHGICNQAHAEFEARFPHAVKHELTMEIVKQKTNAPFPQGVRAMDRTHTDTALLLRINTRGFTP